MSSLSDAVRLWSATPTPFYDDLSPDVSSVARLVEHHIELGVEGIMFGGTCGEGPWMPMDDLAEVVRAAADAGGGCIKIAAQVTDNSSRRMLEHIGRLEAAGAEYAVVASPYFLMNATPRGILDLYLEVIRQSPIPVGFYDRGRHAAYPVDMEFLPELLSEPNLHLVKDSSADPARLHLFLEAEKQRSGLSIFTGDEFHCDQSLEAGCRGLLLGGGIFNARLARAIGIAVAGGRIKDAQRLQARMNELMYRVYGGTKITCWLAGLKYLLVQLGVFAGDSCYLGYPLTPECRAAIDEIVTGADADNYRGDLEPDFASPIASHA